MNSNGKARIGIVGAGFWAAFFYLPYFRQLPEVELVGVVRRNKDALAAMKREYDLEVATDSVEELLAAGCDGVVVASPQALHLEHTTAALDAGAHVLVEKPMTVTLTDAVALEEAARRSGKEVSVAYGWNYSKLAEFGTHVVDTGDLGPTRWIMGVMASSLVDLFSGTAGYGTIDVGGFQVEAQPETWADPNAGGGYVYGQLSHELGLALSLVRSDPRKVFASAQWLPNGVDIDVHVNVEFEDGAIGSFSGHGRSPFGVRYPLEVRVAGDHGILTLDFEHDEAEAHVGSAESALDSLPEGEVAFRGREPEHRADLEPGAGIYTCEGPAQFLVDSCLGRPTVNRAPVELGRRAVAVMEAAIRSARAGEAVEVASLVAR